VAAAIGEAAICVTVLVGARPGDPSSSQPPARARPLRQRREHLAPGERPAPQDVVVVQALSLLI
jgi:hypothetical protein